MCMASCALSSTLTHVSILQELNENISELDSKLEALESVNKEQKSAFDDLTTEHKQACDLLKEETEIRMLLEQEKKRTEKELASVQSDNSELKATLTSTQEQVNLFFIFRSFYLSPLFLSPPPSCLPFPTPSFPLSLLFFFFRHLFSPSSLFINSVPILLSFFNF